MNSKLLLLLSAALLGVVLLVLLIPMGRLLEQEDPVLVSAGHFVLEAHGLPMLEEMYALEYHPAEGYLLTSVGEIVVDGETVSLAQQTQYDHRFVPCYYHLAADTPSGTRIVSAELNDAWLEMRVQSEEAVYSATAAAADGRLALLDNNLIGQFVVLLHAIRAEHLDRRFIAAIPQALLSLPARVEGPNSVVFYADGEPRRGRQFDLYLADAVIVLIEEEGHLVALANPARGTLGYDLVRYPSGVSLEALPGEDSTG